MTEHKRFPGSACLTGALVTLFVVTASHAPSVCAQSARTANADVRASTPTADRSHGRRSQSTERDDEAILFVQRHGQAINRKGFDLARRGALYSAQAEFVRTLKVIGRARDELQHTNRNQDAIFAALAALDEVDDFQDVQMSTSPGPGIAETITKHRTIALKNRDVSKLTVIGATRAYCAFAQDRLLVGCGRVPAASRALYGLGKIELAIAREPGNATTLGSPKAMAMFEAALRVDPENHKAANALGVLLTRYGQHRLAIRFLQKSVRAYPTTEAWQSLSESHDALGETQLAQQAASQCEAIRQQKRPGQTSIQSAGINIRWVDQATFVTDSPPDVTPPETKESQPSPKKTASRTNDDDRKSQTATADPSTARSNPPASTKFGLDRLKSGLKSILR